MGGVLSSSNVVAAKTENISNTETKPTETVTSPNTNPMTAAMPEATSDPVNEVVSDKKTEEASVTVEDRPEEVIERYVEKPGTKVEVAPVEVAPADDVVKKTKKKNKNKNKSKQETQN
jgi:hypothetical protein